VQSAGVDVLDFTLRDLNSRGSACKSGIFSHHIFSTEKVCIYLELSMLNNSTKKFANVTKSKNYRVLFFY
jgi:hypothetical protein